MFRSLPPVTMKNLSRCFFNVFDCPRGSESRMSNAISRWILPSRSLSSFSTICRTHSLFTENFKPLLPSCMNNYQYQPVRYAARKGTRARKLAKKVKKVEVKREFVYKQHAKLALIPYKKQRPIDDSQLELPVDDVYFIHRFRSKAYPFEEVVKFLRESHHPTVYNAPDAPVYLRMNLDLVYPNRATKNMDGWKSVVEMKSPFLLKGMIQPSVMAFCKEDVDHIEMVKKEGGADIAGGKELIKAIQTGEVSAEQYEYIVADPSIVNELTAIRGLIKRKFPTIKSRTISTDLVAETKRLKSGLKIHVVSSDREPDFGYIEAPLGTLDMGGLIENFKSILFDTLPRRVVNKAPEDFVISCILSTPGNGFETFKVDLAPMFEEFQIHRANKQAAAAQNRDEE